MTAAVLVLATAALVYLAVSVLIGLVVALREQMREAYWTATYEKRGAR